MTALIFITAGECGSAPGNLLPHVSEQFSENLVQHDSHDLTIRRDKRQLDCSQSSVHGNSAENNSCMSNDQEEHKYFHPKSKDMQSKDLNNNIKKIISTFESNTYQDVRSFDQRANLRRTNLVTGVSPNSAVADGSHLKFPQALSKSFSAGMLLEMGSKESKKHVDSHFVQKNKETQNSVSTTSSDALESKKQLEILKNDKMIEKVDSCTKDTLPDIPYSVASIRSIATENVPKMNDNSKESKKHVDSHFVKKNKEAQNSVITTSSDTFEMKNDKVIQKVDSCTKDTLPDTPNSAASNRSMATEDVLKMSDTKEFTGLNTSIAAGSERKRFEFVLDERSSSTMPTLKNYEAVEGKLNFNPMFKGGGNQDTDATFEAFQEMPSSSSGKLESICEHNGKGKRQQKEIFDESKRIEDPNNMPIHQKETSIMIARKVCDETVLSGLSMDIVPASSYGKASAWIFGYSSLCPVGILGLWIPRHLCITTGSKILKDFCGFMCCHKCSNFY
ncbi:hypothetical protein HPP92_009135 [Vanilla planifolia]|uniref:Uncharacterized protein n=1 Tax=Vanilla planifolia TaxID=51239 RepID=A0A835R9E9_VANPL|nr:hypothetical protein HPP92_009135 [Vanilla planifolia]